MRKHNILEERLCKELDMLEDKYKSGNVDMTTSDLEKIDKLYHALKSKATYDAMKEAYNEGEEDGLSGRRGRAANGRYVSMDDQPRMRGYSNDYGASYDDGYSGYWPMHPPRGPYGPRY